MKYRDGDPIPDGYHLEEQPRMGPIITGYAIGIPAYAIGLVAAASDGFENGKQWLALPVAGPWMTLATRESCDFFSETEDGDHVTCFDYAPFLLVFDGVLQGTGALLILIGYSAPRTWLIRDGSDVSLAVQPMRVGTGNGAGLVGTF